MTRIRCACDEKHTTTKSVTAGVGLKAAPPGRGVQLRADMRTAVAAVRSCDDQRVAVSVRMQS